MIELEDIEQIIKEIQVRISKDKIEVITIDGDTGAGKSTLATSISTRIGVIHLKLDNERYLYKNQGGCLKYIKYETLFNDIKEIISTGKIVLVDSVCILKILKNINIKSDLNIYVKRVSIYGFWYDGDRFDYRRSATEVIQEEKDNALKLLTIIRSLKTNDNVNGENKNTLNDEIIEYHFEYRPDNKADIVYRRIDNSD